MPRLDHTGAVSRGTEACGQPDQHQQSDLHHESRTGSSGKYPVRVTANTTLIATLPGRLRPLGEPVRSQKIMYGRP